MSEFGSGHNLPVVSICIPTYKRSGLLADAIRSVLDQTYRDFELLVVDDASGDETAQVVASFPDPRIRYHCNERNVGIIPNLNRCLALARGRYVAILPDDDVWRPQFLERTIGFFNQVGGLGFVRTAWYESYGSTETHLRKRWRNDRLLVGRAECYRLLREGNDIACCSMLTSRESFQQVGFFDEGVHPMVADVDMWLRIALRFDGGYVSEPLATFRWGANATHQYTDSRARLARSEPEFFKFLLKIALASLEAGFEPAEAQRLLAVGHAERQLALAYRYYRIGAMREARLHVLRSIKADLGSLLKRPHVLAYLLTVSLLGHRFARIFSAMERKVHTLSRNVGAA